VSALDLSLQDSVITTDQRRLCPVTRNKRVPDRCVTKPPLILLGGEVNALSISRSLSAAGVEVYALGESSSPLRFSRHCHWITTPPKCAAEDAWAEFLSRSDSDHLQGSVLLAACDSAIEFIAHNRETLAEKFLLDESDPQSQLCMLDKLCTYRTAREAGVPTPRFWSLDSLDCIDAIRSQLVYPLLVKPRLSHLFVPRFKTKYLLVSCFDELVTTLQKVKDTNIEYLLMEYIEGADDQLCSYYTYLDSDGQPLFHFTKRVVRRHPINQGNACYHVTDHNDELHELSLRLFDQAGLRGMANAEFKRDARDGTLKLMECNARFTAANGLVAESGLDLGLFVYNRVTGQPHADYTDYRDNVRLWYPVEDFRAFLQLHSRGELTLLRWLRSIMHRKTLPVFRWTDPLPSLVGVARYVRRLASKTCRSLRRCQIWSTRSSSQPSVLQSK